MSEEKINEQERLVQLEEEAAQNLLGWQTALADYQNLQKESEQKIISLKSWLVTDIISELLPIFDNYQTALEHIPSNNKQDSWAVGLEHILKMWESFLSSHNIKKIKTVGELFDPHQHEAIGQIQDDSKPDQEIVEEKQAGFQAEGQIIRPAKVIINQLS